MKGDKVRIGINAPHAIPVHRKEVYLAIKQANLEAAQGAPQSLDDLKKLMDEQAKKKTKGKEAQDGTPH